MSAALVGLVLAFGDVDAKTMSLALDLNATATVALTWGTATRASTVAAMRHVFMDLPAPREEDLPVRVELARGVTFASNVRALSPRGTLRVGLLGDTRGGGGPNAILLEAMVREAPDFIVHTGDIVAYASDLDGWLAFRARMLEMARRSGFLVPFVVSLGNHDVYVPLELRATLHSHRFALGFVPMPRDPLAQQYELLPSVYRLRVGSTLWVILDTNLPLDHSSSQFRFVREALSTSPRPGVAFVVMHHGPYTGGQHGPHPETEALSRVFSENRVAAVWSGHEHVYQRIHRDGVLYLVSGGGGAPLYSRGRPERGLITFASTYHRVALSIEGAAGSFEVTSLEGARLDEGRFPLKDDHVLGTKGTERWSGIAGMLVAGVAILVATLHLAFRGVRVAR